MRTAEWGTSRGALFDVMVPPIPEEKLRALLAVLYRACVVAHMLGYEGHQRGCGRRAEFLADMMDAVHDIPQLLLRWPEVNESLLRGMLSEFDQKWWSEGVSLGAAFDGAVARPEG